MSDESDFGTAFPAEAAVSQTHSVSDNEAQQNLPPPVRRFDGI